MESENDTQPVPSERQLRVLDDVRARLSSRWPVSPVHRKEHFRHWEDEATGIPSLGESAWFTVKLPIIELTIGTPLPWEDEPAHRLVASFSDYEAGNNGEPWALVVDAQARIALSNAGFEAGMRGRTWSLRDATDSVIREAIVESVSRLSTVPFQVLRPHDLPANSKWPWRGLIGVLAADKIVSIEDRADARHEITSETDGRRAQTVVDAKDMELLRWWWDVGSRALLEKERR